MASLLTAADALPAVAEWPAPFLPARITVEQYQRMLDAGILHEDDPIELLDGLLVRKMTKNPPHDTAVLLTEQALRSRLPDGWHLRNQSVVQLDDSRPEPDLAVAAGAILDYCDRHPEPGDLALVIEVAESSLSIDRRKGPLYAAGGVAVYWIINLIDDCVEVYSSPQGEGTDAAYAHVEVFRADAEAPLILAGEHVAMIPVDMMLP